ncbi:hypothetical protein Dimus_010851 [Dionaea muscipula]
MGRVSFLSSASLKLGIMVSLVLIPVLDLHFSRGLLTRLQDRRQKIKLIGELSLAMPDLGLGWSLAVHGALAMHGLPLSLNFAWKRGARPLSWQLGLLALFLSSATAYARHVAGLGIFKRGGGHESYHISGSRPLTS